MKIGDRVRMVQTASHGVVVSEVFKSDLDGGERIKVKWDNSGNTNAWHPVFLRPADTNPEHDPDEVQFGELARRKGRSYFDNQGTLVVEPEGFFKVSRAATNPRTPAHEPSRSDPH